MEQLRNICTKDMSEMVKALRESQDREQMAMERKGRIVPNAHGNRKQRRAAESIARKRERA